ncbi:MAG TPA: 4-alpha-glucanotransferase [Longimicrobiales bacterium]|nr:4-alpha-glucanotransferase [Longimicrobiales bacterium]
MKTGSRGLVGLARLYGVEMSYEAMDGRAVTAEPEALAATLRALGAELREDGRGGGQALRARRAQLDAVGIQPVHVAWDGVLREIRVRLEGGERQAAAIQIRLESGEVITQHAEALPVAPRARGGWTATHRIPLSRRLDIGYHEIQVETAGVTLETFVIAAPRRAFLPEQPHTWGLFVPLYALQSSTSWGIGDYSDLGAFASWAGDLGAGFISTLPLLATFLDAPFDPSPYSPASRLFWNELFVDVTKVPGWDDMRPDTTAELADLRVGRYVDYRRTAALKRRELQRALRNASDHGPFRDELQRAAEAMPRLADYARFRAVGDRMRSGWPTWPDRLRAGDVRAEDFDRDDFDYHVFAQWQSDQQIGAMGTAGDDDVAALYLDMPLGVNPDSYDVWRFRDLFADRVSAGAPPDPLFTGGQDWGFRPLIPDALRASRYRYLIDVFRHHLRHARMLRLDHVMSLYRLFWVPRGQPATAGVYVRYPEEELFAILVLESARHRAVVIGEDLGTVPPAVRTAMERHGVQRMHVMQFEAAPDRSPPAPAPDADVVASLNTHDMPTFAGFWRGSEIDDQIDLGLIDESDHAAAMASRARLREQLSRSLGAGGTVDAALVRQRLLERLAVSPAHFVLVNLEDLWLEERPQNVPGTSHERPNWMRRAARSLDAIMADPALRRMLSSIDSRRRQAQQQTETAHA